MSSRAISEPRVHGTDKRVAYMNRLLNEPWGGGVHARGLLDGIAYLGHEVWSYPAVHPSDTGGDQQTVIERFSWLPGPVRVVGLEVRWWLTHLTRAAGVVERLDGFRPDIVVARRAMYDAVVDAVWRQTKARRIAECNGIHSIELRSRGHVRGMTTAEASREISFLRSADVVYCVSDEVADQARSIGVQDERIVVAANGVDPLAFRPDVLADPEVAEWAEGRSAVIGYCSTEAVVHDIASIAMAATCIAEKVPGVGFVFAGPGERYLREAGLAALIDSGAVLSLGRVQHSRVPSVLACCDVFWAALTNVYGSPLKLIEYMAMGRPTVISATGSGVECVVVAGAGAVVPPSDVERLCAETARRATDSALRTQEGASARTWVLANATWAAVAECVLEAGAQ